MLSCHLAHAHVGTDNDHGVVRHETNKAEHSGLEIFLVTTQVQESNQALRVLRDVRPRLVLVGIHVLHLHLIVLSVKSHDLLTNGRCSAIRLLVTEVEYLLTCRASSIIHYTLGEDTHHGALT